MLPATLISTGWSKLWKASMHRGMQQLLFQVFMIPAGVDVAPYFKAMHVPLGILGSCTGDVTAVDFAAKAVETTMEVFGSLTIIVNNAGADGNSKLGWESAMEVFAHLFPSRLAGYTWDGMLHRMSSKQWQAMLDVHCTAPFKLIQVMMLGFF